MTDIEALRVKADALLGEALDALRRASDIEGRPMTSRNLAAHEAACHDARVAAEASVAAAQELRAAIAADA